MRGLAEIGLFLVTFNVWRDAPFDVLTPELNPDLDKKKHKPHQVWGEEDNGRKNVTMQFFKEQVGQGVDVFGLQECTKTMLDALVQEVLPSHYEAPFAEFVDKNEEQLLYRADLFELLHKTWGSLSQTAAKYAYSILKLRHKESGRTFIIANTHLAWQGGGTSQVRADQMTNVVEAIANVPRDPSENDLPIVVMGDFNDVYVPVEVAFDKLGVKPSFILQDHPSTAPHTLPTPMGDPHEEVDSWAAKTYDWILSRGLQVKQTARIDFNIDGIYPSDHYPVFVRYT